MFLSQAQKQGATGEGPAHGAATRQVYRSQAPSFRAHGGQGLPRPCLALCSSPSSPRKPVRDWAFSANNLPCATAGYPVYPVLSWTGGWVAQT